MAGENRLGCLGTVVLVLVLGYAAGQAKDLWRRLAFEASGSSLPETQKAFCVAMGAYQERYDQLIARAETEGNGLVRNDLQKQATELVLQRSQAVLTAVPKGEVYLWRSTLTSIDEALFGGFLVTGDLLCATPVTFTASFEDTRASREMLKRLVTGTDAFLFGSLALEDGMIRTVALTEGGRMHDPAISLTLDRINQ